MLIQLPDGTWVKAGTITDIHARMIGGGAFFRVMSGDRQVVALQYGTLAEAEEARDELAAKVNAAMKGE